MKLIPNPFDRSRGKKVGPVDRVEPVEPWPDPPQELGLAEAHEELMAIGRCYYHQSDNGTWSVRVKLPTSNPSVTAELQSGFSHPTLLAAILAALDKARE